MARAADQACIQFRVLNRGKGPAVHSGCGRRQHRRRYQELMKHTLEQQEHLSLKQAMVTEIRTEGGAVSAIRTQLGAVYPVRAAIVCSGTYLSSRVITGECVYESGPDGMHAAVGLSDCLQGLGLSLRRFKTGTPPRVNRRSIDFSRMEVQSGMKSLYLSAFLPGRCTKQGGMLSDLYQRRDAPGHSGQSPSKPPVFPA